MPRIPTYEQQSTPQAALNPGSLDTGGQMVARGLGNIAQGARQVGGSLAYAEEVTRRKDDADSVAETNLDITNGDQKWDQWTIEQQAAQQGDPTGFTGKGLEGFDKYAGEVIGKARTPKAKQFATQQLAQQRSSLSGRWLQWETNKGIDHRANQYRRSIDNQRKAVRTDPSRFDQVLEQQGRVLSELSLPGDVRDKLWEETKQGIASSAVESLVERSPYQALKMLKAEPGKSGSAAVDALSADGLERARDYAQRQVDHLEAKAEAAAARNEARGERALAEMDRQLASGIPATQQMWADWQDRVAGTPAAAGFNDRIKAEREVQHVLRLPIDQQVKFAQDQQARLMTEGGTPQDGANVARLTSAISANVKQLQTDPLLFQQNRTGADVAPLDFSVLSGQGDAKAFADQVRGRVDTITGMRKQYGTQVPIKPLLPQEAAQLGALLQGATPKQATAVYAQLRTAAGSDTAYTAMMNQISPDAPVRAIAGSLAAKQRQMTLQRNWIADDVVATSRDVSATLLEGDAILSDKSEASSKKLFLPETKSLQAEFTRQVGKAFANRPGAADIAFQAVQAYYVGKASQTGRLAKDGTDIDTKLVREAVTASLGTVVDYNGQGEVLAPWGMSEGEFQDKASAAIRARLPEAQRDREGALGLRQEKGTSYYVTQGRNFVTDAKGNPLVINLGAP